MGEAKPVNKIDFADIARRLQDLAEAYDRRPLAEGAIKAWWSTLESLQAFDVHCVLDDWLRSVNKFPTPADIYRAANERGIDRREAAAAQMKAQEVQEVKHMGATPQGRRALALIREMLAKKVASPDDPKAWARKILDRYADGEQLPHTSFMFACEALHMDPEAVKASRKGAA